MKETTEDLLEQIENNRSEISKRVEELEILTKDVDTLIPKVYTNSSRYILMDRIKAMTELYSTILDYRTKINDISLSEIKIKKDLSSVDDIGKILSELGSVNSIEMTSIKPDDVLSSKPMLTENKQ
jgi:hypothetical protein